MAVHVYSPVDELLTARMVRVEMVEGGTTEVTTSTPGLSSVRGRPSWLQSNSTTGG